MDNLGHSSAHWDKSFELRYFYSPSVQSYHSTTQPKHDEKILVSTHRIKLADLTRTTSMFFIKESWNH